MEILSMRAELLHADGQTVRWTDLTNLIVAFRNFANAPKKYWILVQLAVKILLNPLKEKEESEGQRHLLQGLGNSPCSALSSVFLLQMEKGGVWKWRRGKVIGSVQLEYATGEIIRTFRMSFEICILRAA